MALKRVHSFSERRRGCAVRFVPIWQDSLDTVFRDIWRSWPMALLHMYKEPIMRMMMITLKVASLVEPGCGEVGARLDLH
jgi:hypothetical protein